MEHMVATQQSRTLIHEIDSYLSACRLCFPFIRKDDKPTYGLGLIDTSFNGIDSALIWMVLDWGT